MSTTIRPELSRKNKYWIERHRYYELKHFCMQYDIWKQASDSITSLVQPRLDLAFSKSTAISNPVERCAMAREFYLVHMNMVERAASETDPYFGSYIFKAVTKGLSYDKLLAQTGIPCCKDVYYEMYRRFFWILNKLRN